MTEGRILICFREVRWELIWIRNLIRESVYKVGNVVENSRIDNRGLSSPNDNFKVPYLEDFQELIPNVVGPVRD